MAKAKAAKAINLIISSLHLLTPLPSNFLLAVMIIYPCRSWGDKKTQQISLLRALPCISLLRSISCISPRTMRAG
jgi:hypothetical protein